MGFKILGGQTKFTNDLGQPLVGGQIYTFYAGTSTPQDTYADALLTIPNTNPIRLDDAGSAEIFLKGSYRVRVFDALGRFIEEQDNLRQTISDADAGLLIDSILSTNTELNKVKLDTGITATAKYGGVERELSDKNTDYITPKDFGATGNTESDLLGLSVIGLDVGGVIHTDNRSFTVAESAATDYDAITVGGAKLYINKEQTSFEARAEFVTAVENGLKIKKGTIVQAGNVSYIYDKTSTEILDLPNFKPFGEPEFEHYGGLTKRSEHTQALVSHYRISSDKILDVVRIVNPKPSTFKAIEHPDMNPTNGVSPRLPLRSLAKLHRVRAAVNSTGFINADGSAGAASSSIKPYGVYISSGTVITDWNTYGNTTRDQVMLCMKDGSLQPRYKSDGGTAQDYVDEGAVWGFSWGVWCLLDSVVQNVSPNFSGGVKSARTIIGQAANGDYIIITSEGVSDSYGLTGDECGAVALEYGCVKAFISDGGGSSQLWWDNFYALPSSDTSFSDERTLCAALAIDCDISSYDTGWISQPLASGYTANGNVGVRFRQTNNAINLEINVNGGFTTTSTEVLAGVRPLRYMPTSGNAVARGFLSGSSGTPASFYLADGLLVQTLTNPTSYVAGACSWAAKHAPSNTTP